MVEFLDIKTKIFSDCANLNEIEKLMGFSWIKGFTTNPTLMRKAGVKDYKVFSKEALRLVNDRPFSFEVFADDLEEMEEQAYEISSWGKNVYVKIPVMNTRKQLTTEIISRLSKKGISINATAVFTIGQVQTILNGLDEETPAIISIFAGRIADTGRNPEDIMTQALKIIKKRSNIELLWASPRELFNLFQASSIGCHIITMSCDLLKKIPSIGKNLDEFSLETVKMFYEDALASNFNISCKVSH